MGQPNAFDGMMHEFCVGLGFCGGVKDGKPLHVTDFIPETGLVSADEFARWLIMADGHDSNQRNAADISRWTLQLKAVFVKHMGADVVDAGNLRSGRSGGRRACAAPGGAQSRLEGKLQ
jgi:hypothetical protein